MASYAPIIAIFGSLSVPAIVLILTVPALGTTPSRLPNAIPFATGLLVIGMFGSLLGALGAAAIGAERRATANLSAAAMYIAVAALIAIISILGAFQVLVALYLPASSTLFALTVAIGGSFAVFFTSFAIYDSPNLEPTDPAWRSGQWLQAEEKARQWAVAVCAIALAPIFIAIGLWLTGITSAPKSVGPDNWLVGIGFLLTVIGTAASQIRASHRLDKKLRGLRSVEAFGTCFAIGVYTAVLIAFLPQP